MVWAIRIIGIVFILLAGLYVWKPEFGRTVLEFFEKRKRIYLAGILRFALAVVFLVGASRCRYPKVIIAFGIVFIISGVVIFAVRLEKLKSILRWWGKRSAIMLRILGLLAMIIGVAVLYCA